MNISIQMFSYGASGGGALGAFGALKCSNWSKVDRFKGSCFVKRSKKVTPEAPRSAKRRQEAPRGAKKRQGAPRSAKKRQEAPRSAKKRQKAPRGAKKRQEAPRSDKKRQEAPNTKTRFLTTYACTDCIFELCIYYNLCFDLCVLYSYLHISDCMIQYYFQFQYLYVSIHNV